MERAAAAAGACRSNFRLQICIKGSLSLSNKPQSREQRSSTTFFSSFVFFCSIQEGSVTEVDAGHIIYRMQGGEPMVVD